MKGENGMSDKEKELKEEIGSEIKQSDHDIEEAKKPSDAKSDDEEYEKVCYVCRRPESRAGKMISMPNHIYICADCMQKTFDTLNSSGIPFGDYLNPSQMSNIPMFNFADLQGPAIPKSQKLKKKKKEEPKTVLDIKKIPAPHKIKAQLDEYVVGQEPVSYTHLYDTACRNCDRFRSAQSGGAYSLLYTKK